MKTILALLVTLLAMPAWGANADAGSALGGSRGWGPGNAYYVDATLGDDADPGTEAEPWQTLSKVGTAVLAPGDTVYFKRGEKWQNQRLSPDESGTQAAPITFAAYGTGPNPVINGAELITGMTLDSPSVTRWLKDVSALNCQFSDGLFEDGVRLDPEASQAAVNASGEWAIVSNILYVQTRNDDDPAGHTIECAALEAPLNLHNVDWLVFKDITIEMGRASGAGLVHTTESDARTDSSNITFDGVVLRHSGTRVRGLKMRGGNEITFKNGMIYDTGDVGFYVDEADNVNFENNDLWDIAPAIQTGFNVDTDNDDADKAAIILGTTSSQKVDYCRIVNNRMNNIGSLGVDLSAESTGNGPPILIDGGSYCLVAGNYVSRTKKGCINVDGGGAQASNNIVVSNVCDKINEDGLSAGTGGNASALKFGEQDDLYVADNVVHDVNDIAGGIISMIWLEQNSNVQLTSSRVSILRNILLISEAALGTRIATYAVDAQGEGAGQVTFPNLNIDYNAYVDVGGGASCASAVSIYEGDLVAPCAPNCANPYTNFATYQAAVSYDQNSTCSTALPGYVPHTR